MPYGSGYDQLFRGLSLRRVGLSDLPHSGSKSRTQGSAGYSGAKLVMKEIRELLSEDGRSEAGLRFHPFYMVTSIQVVTLLAFSDKVMLCRSEFTFRQNRLNFVAKLRSQLRGESAF
jgi:hypothetical protein